VHSSVETAISGVQTQVSQQMAALTAAFDGLAAHGHSAAGEQCAAAQSALVRLTSNCGLVFAVLYQFAFENVWIFNIFY
jgi:hypothetical protein